MSNSTHQAGTIPWPRVAALLSGCTATLIGVAVQLEPHVILTRAAIAACVVGIVTACSQNLIRSQT